MTAAFAYFLTVLAGRTIVVAVCLIAGLRWLGKRQLGQMNIYDLALVMALANAIQNAMTAGKGELSVGLVCAGALLVLGRILAALFVHDPRAEQRITGIPTLIVHDGRLDRDRMRREHVTEEQVMAAIRQHGLTRLKQVKLAVLEVDGSLSIIPRKAEAS